VWDFSVREFVAVPLYFSVLISTVACRPQGASSLNYTG
jgi:hypothetical protein